MKKSIFTALFFLIIANIIQAQLVMPSMNSLNPKEFGESKELDIQTENMKEKGVQSVKIKVEVRLVKSIVMGCQYIHRVTNLSADQTIDMEMYTVPDHKFSEKIKPGKSVELLTNTMSKCGGKKKEEGCINCEPSLNVTSFKVK